MSAKESHLDAEEFMKATRQSQRSVVVIQNTYKAIVKLIEAHAEVKGKRIPRSHHQVATYAHGARAGKEVSVLLDMYLTSYRGQDGERAGEALKLAEVVFKRLSKDVKAKI